MSNPQNIAVVTIEWSDDYTGSDLSGHYGGEGNEKYIFRPYRGRFYGYFPPNGVNFPSPKDGNDWLVFFVSRPAPNAPAVVVGWYEDASITGETPRPDSDKLGLNSERSQFSYSASAPSAVSVPVAARDCLLPKGGSLRSFTFVRTNGVNKKSRALLVKTLLAYRERFKEVATDPAIGGSPSVVDPILRRKIEKAALAAVKADYGKGYLFKDKQSQRGIGYDLEFIDRKTNEIWCIEVKGTAGARDAFFITRSERQAARDILEEEEETCLRRWRLALVTCALDPVHRRIEYLDSNEMEARFDFQCLQWQAISKSKAGE